MNPRDFTGQAAREAQDEWEARETALGHRPDTTAGTEPLDKPETAHLAVIRLQPKMKPTPIPELRTGEKLSTHQLRAMIQKMEARDQYGPHDAARRAEKPGEAILRREKLTAYRAELERRRESEAKEKEREKRESQTDQPGPAPAAAAPAADGLSALDRAVEELVRQYSCGSVIDAAWEASHRVHPWKAGRP